MFKKLLLGGEMATSKGHKPSYKRGLFMASRKCFFGFTGKRQCMSKMSNDMRNWLK